MTISEDDCVSFTWRYYTATRCDIIYGVTKMIMIRGNWNMDNGGDRGNEENSCDMPAGSGYSEDVITSC